MFFVIALISIATGIIQVISTSFDLKAPNKTGISKITVWGWMFYFFTLVLAFMPIIQNELQNRNDKENENNRKRDQELRDASLRKSYDSSLVEMKKKFDTTTFIVSETLGKYGYKLDSTNQTLVRISDRSMETPVLSLSDQEGIVFDSVTADKKYIWKMIFTSYDAGSSFYNIKLDVVLERGNKLEYVEFKQSSPSIIQGPLWKNAEMAYSFFLTNLDGYTDIFFRVYGSYKRLDGTGDFVIDDVYQYNRQGLEILLIYGQKRKDIIDLIKSYKK